MRSRECNVLEHHLWIKAIPFGDWHNALWPESAFTIDVHGHAGTASFFDILLASDAQLVAKLSLPGAILTVQLGDSAGLDAAFE